jgi:hypothetical protein
LGDQPNALAIALAGNLRLAKERLKLLFNPFELGGGTMPKPNIVSRIERDEILEHGSHRQTPGADCHEETGPAIDGAQLGDRARNVVGKKRYRARQVDKGAQHSPD